ncbi:Hpt domain-containing protein [Dokdonella sp.]|uniref:hybrid sensor histidine kinase/response regulator n=1 Tax=Dokdonella sp. TaxID=2291710 RepID=UPI0025C20028|nr:Hpt domain-containing protein [Dokdonella sp.]MBX3690861.1 Hpt domain-containing protein [Dokdonella sp.]MCW5567594.1 Hpt domain-containing protein [Dokdonella sp.]
MKLQDDFTTLNWVKGELDETLKQARQALEAYVDDPADASLMQFCSTYLHQAQGSLRMVELYGAAMVVEEMERVAEALLADAVRQREEAYSILMRGMVQLPDYLERVQSGHKDIPIVLLPLLNDLRACRGEKLLTESVLFAPDLSLPLPAEAKGLVAPLPQKELQAQALRLRLAFQAALLKWFREAGVPQHPHRLRDILDRLRTSVAHGEHPRRLFWIAAAVADAIGDGALESSAAVKLLFGGVDREIRRFGDTGEAAFAATPPRDLVQNLLYYIAHSTSQSGRVQLIRDTYRLGSLLPTDAEVEHARGSMAGHNRTLLDTVSVAIKDDLLRVKEALDIFLRAQNRDSADLVSQVDLLDRVRDTLGMLGLGVPRRVVTEQRGIIEDIAAGRRQADEGTLLDVAGALLYVESSLDDHIERLGAANAEADDGALELPKAEVRKILDALMREASVNIQQAKHDIVAFIESPWDHARVEQIPRLLEEISGAMRMLDLGEAAELMGGLIRFVEVELLQHRRVPTTEQMDQLADALASIEYYLEATREQRAGREKILAVTRSSLEALGYWPVPPPLDDGPGLDPGPRSGPDGDPPPPEGAPDESLLAAAAALAYGTADEPASAASASSLAFAGEAPSDASFPSWSEPLPVEQEAALHIGETESNEGIELAPIDVDLTAFVDVLVAPADGEAGAAAVPSDPAAVDGQELDSIVEIAAGSDLRGLIVGDAPAHQPEEQDLAGLRLVETFERDAVPELEVSPPVDAVDQAASTDADADAVDWIEISEEVEEEIEDDETGAPAVGSSGFQVDADSGIDDEIRDVFIEEVQEEIDGLGTALPAWKANLDDLEQLKPIRRAFHTMKGSGRLVGALTLGEFSWKVENMLNRVLDRTIQPAPQVYALVQHAVDALPGLLAALRGDGVIEADIGAIMDTADRLGAGEMVEVPKRQPVGRRTIKRIVTRRVAVPKAPPATPAEPTHDLTSAAPVAIESAHSESIVAGPLPGLDPVLFDILKSETALHLGVVDDFLEQSRYVPLPVSEAVLRAVHTLSGAIAMVEIAPLAQVLAPLEGYLKRARAEAAPLAAEGLAVIAESSEIVREVMRRLDEGSSALPDSTALAERISAMRDELAEPVSALEFYHEGHADEGDVGAEDVAVAAVGPDEELVGLDELTAELEGLAGEMVEPSITADDAEAAVAVEVTRMFAGQLPSGDAELVDAGILLSAANVFEQLPDKPAAVAESAAGAADAEAGDIALEGDVAEVSGTSGEDLDSTVAEVSIAANDGAEPLQELESEWFAVADVDGEPVSAEADEPLLEAQAFADEVVLGFETPVAVDEAVVESTEAIESEEAIESDEAIESEASVVDVEQAGAELEVLLGETGAALEDEQPEGRLELPEMDEDLLDIFVLEGNDILDQADTTMARLRETPHERELLGGLQRNLHTLKGGARMAGLAPIGDLAHVMESLLDAVQEGLREMDRPAVEALERGFDGLHGLVQRVARRQAIAMPERAIMRFENLVAGETLSAPTASDRAAAAAAVSEPAPAPAPAPVRPAPRPMPVAEIEEEARAPQEMIRVRSELLDSLVNYAGEVSIYRSRLEQQISTFRFNLIEFEQTVSRLREQLRKLEIETEAQIIARYQREHHEGADATFDPLELDRFSQLQQYSRALGESVSDLVSIQGLLDDLTRQSETLLLQQSRVSSDLQEGLMRTRMVPFDSLVPSLRRTLRQAAQETGKRAQLKVEGAQGEMDRNLLERMKAPFEHMLRNALAHGIETPEQRLAAGKPLDGTVTIAVTRESTEVVLRITDDGAGMDRDAIRAKAISQGMLSPDAQLSDRDLYGFIMEPGFSTAEQVTQLSGRGVGMDVVLSEIKQLGGSLVIDSKPGEGSVFTIRLPFTLAVTQAILVRLGDAVYAVPMSSVQGVVRIALDDYQRRMTSGNPTYAYAGDEFSIYELSHLLGVPPGRIVDETQLPLLMTRTGDQRAAVRIDAVVGSREIVVKSVGPQISSVPGIFGATIMGDGSVVMILDLAPLVRRVSALRASVAAGEVSEMPAAAEPVAVETRRNPLIMVVDDSITMRKVTTRVLERADMEVITAKDGLDAVEKLQDNVPDLMLLDIEMPRMDGYELATYMRNDARLRGVPIIMVTSRTGEKHRQRAIEIGVERYLGKPYQEADLLRNVQETLRAHRVDA